MSFNRQRLPFPSIPTGWVLCTDIHTHTRICIWINYQRKLGQSEGQKCISSRQNWKVAPNNAPNPSRMLFFLFFICRYTHIFMGLFCFCWFLLRELIFVWPLWEPFYWSVGIKKSIHIHTYSHPNAMHIYKADGCDHEEDIGNMQML